MQSNNYSIFVRVKMSGYGTKELLLTSAYGLIQY